MPFTTLLSGLALLSTTGWAGYVLDQDYMAGGNFFEQFDFWDSADPTHGFVSYQAQDSAQNLGLINSSDSNIMMGVDHTNVVTDGRPSVRITSKASYQSGLFIIDLDHMPGGICGTWPAFWLVGPDWPNQGEIDIIEGANNQQTNSFTLHTGPGCSIGGGSSTGSSLAQSFSGSVSTSDCDVNAAGQPNNVGCGITTTNTATYGSGFNSAGGGVFATEWSDSGIAIYFFGSDSVPSDISSGSPDPSSWGEPVALFSGGCNFAERFTNQQIVFDTTFCGDWAGATWSDQCGSQASTCEAYVGNTPGAFEEAYWSVNSLKVYQNDGSSAPAPSGAPSGAPSSAPPAPSSAAPSAPAPSGWGSSAPAPSGWGSSAPAPSGWNISAPVPSAAPHSSFATHPSAAPVPSGAPSGVVSMVPPPASSSSTHQHSREWGWPGPASRTYSSAASWQSGGWNEVENSDGSYSVGQRVQGDVVTEENVKRESVVNVDVTRIHSRHLAKHRRARHAGGGL